MNFETLARFVQEHFTDGLALVVGSGLSSAEGIPGMPALAAYLDSQSDSLSGEEASLWSKIKLSLDAGDGLEAALLMHAPSDALEAWIAQKTSELLLPREREVVSAVLRGERVLRLTKLLSKILRPSNGLPILTTNYDRLIEVACEMAGFHVDTTAVGQYAGVFDHERSCMGSCKGIKTRAKVTILDHFPRAIVLKPHGSFDWYKCGNEARRCNFDLDAERLIITPGLNKYRAGYNSPFDKHRDLANDFIKQASRFLVVGYGFNDDHLQTHLVKRMQDGTPTLIINRSMSEQVAELARGIPSCVVISELSASDGATMITKGQQFEYPGHNIWDIGMLAEEILT